jgi:fumarylacetoacetate (FAA) hydrolase family protein
MIRRLRCARPKASASAISMRWWRTRRPTSATPHKRDDIVTIAAPKLGKLTNRMRASDECEPWTFGVGALMKNLAQRKLL